MKLPDYEQYVLSVYRDDATSDSNAAAVPLWQALWLTTWSKKITTSCRPSWVSKKLHQPKPLLS